MEYPNFYEGYDSFLSPPTTPPDDYSMSLSLEQFNPCKGDNSDMRFLSSLTLGEDVCYNDELGLLYI